MTAVATSLNEEWKDTGVRVFALADYYQQGAPATTGWIEAAFGYDGTVGRHAGTSDTSQMLLRPPVRSAKGPAGTVGRSAGFWRDGRSGEGNRRDREDRRRAEGQRRHQSVQTAQEPAGSRERTRIVDRAR